MHGIHHLFRQQALEKEASLDSWQSSFSSKGTENILNCDLNMSNDNWDQGNTELNCLKDHVSSDNPNIDKVLNQLHSASSPQPVPNTMRSPEFGGYNHTNLGNRRSPYGRPIDIPNSGKRTTPVRKSSHHERAVSPVSFNFFRAFLISVNITLNFTVSNN